MRTKRLKILLILATSTIILHSFPQSRKIDSLKTLLKKDKEDTTKVIHLNNLSNTLCINGDYENALIYGNSANKLAKKLDFNFGIGRSYSCIGFVYDYQGIFDLAIQNYDSALCYYKLAEEKYKIISNLKIANTYNNIGNIYNLQNKHGNALKNYFYSLQIKRNIKDTAGVASAYNNIAFTFDTKKDFNNALKYYYKSLKIYNKLNDHTHVASLYINIGVIYTNKENYPKALNYIIKSLKISKEYDYKDLISKSYYNIGNIYYNQKSYKKALDYYFKSLKICEEIKDDYTILNNYYQIGLIYKNLNKHKEAEDYFNKSLQLSGKFSRKESISDNYRNLSDIYSNYGNYKKAYDFLKQNSLYRDTLDRIGQENYNKASEEIVTENKQIKIDALDKYRLYQTEKLQRQKIQMIGLSVIVCLLLFMAIVIYRSYIIKKRDNIIIAAEKKRSELLLLNILPSETADELKLHGKAEAKDYDMVTVLFTDFKGFTMLSEKLTPTQLVNEIDYCFKEFDKITMKYMIEKIKTIGDSYMCAGGLPSANKTNPTDVVRAGIEIQQFMKTYKKEKQEKGELFFELRLGIHTGPVVSGVVGIKKFAYDIWGDTVNTASRMESSGEVGKVNISGVTYEYIKDKFVCTYRGKIEAKNKGAIDMYFVEREI